MHTFKHRLADESLLLLIFALYVAMRVLGLPGQVGQDSWLTLLAGREVVDNGLPSVETLTVLARGTEWVDQQWLGQLIFYGAEQLGTLKAALALHALLVTGAVAAAIAAARSLGGSTRRVARIALLAVVAIVLTTWYMRTQSLAYLLFVGVLWLLIADARSPSRRVLFVFPLLVLWANIHGSVVLGVALVGLRALTTVVGVRPPRLQLGNLPRAAALGAGAVVCLFASPYGLDLVGYYRDTLANPEFAKFVTEWQASTPKPLTAPFYALAFAATWIMARNAGRVTPFELLALAITLAGGLLAIRNIAWFAFAALMILPSALAAAPDDDKEDAPLALRFGVAMLACAIIVASSVSFLARAPDSFEHENYPSALGRSIEQAAKDPSARVYASLRHADWILWKYPWLANRVAFDARFELLPGEQLSRIYQFLSQVGHGWEQHAAGYSIVVLPRDRGIAIPHTLPTYRVLLAKGGWRLDYRDDDSVVLVRRQTRS